MNLLSVLLLVLLYNCDAQDYTGVKAVARMMALLEHGHPLPANEYSTISIVQVNKSEAEITWDLRGFDPNSNASIFVHEFGDSSKFSGQSLGDIFNPMGALAGCYPYERRMGDLIQTLRFDEQGSSSGSAIRDMVELFGEHSIVGRSIVIHQGESTCLEEAKPVLLAAGPLGIAEWDTTAAESAEVEVDQVLMAAMHGTTGYDGINGRVMFVTHGDGVMQVYVQIMDLPYRLQKHGLHIHAFGDETSFDGMATGGHYNPTDVAHGIPGYDDEFHIGDLGNVWSETGLYDGNIEAYFELKDRSAHRTLTGLAVVLHAGEDLGSEHQPAGASGRRAAVGVIGFSGRAYPRPRETDPVLFKLEYIWIACGVMAFGVGLKYFKDTKPKKQETQKVKGRFQQANANNIQSKSDAQGQYLPPSRV